MPPHDFETRGPVGPAVVDDLDDLELPVGVAGVSVLDQERLSRPGEQRAASWS
jgi:hypothetical protein